jgi:hypothetical protein
MSILRPSDPTTPPDPLGSKADLHVTGITGVITLLVLLALNDTLFRHQQAPQDLGYVISPAVSYGVSLLAGRLQRYRLVRRAEPVLAPVLAAAEQVAERDLGGEAPGTAMPR